MICHRFRPGLHRVFSALLVLFAVIAAASLAAAGAEAPDIAARPPRIAPFTDPHFFPIGVWLQNPDTAERYRAAGINLFVGLWKGPTAAQLRRLAEAKMWVICAQNDVALTSPDRDIIIGWLQPDEPDNAQRRANLPGYGSPVPPSRVIEDYHAMRAKDPTRPVLLGLGQGVAWDGWWGRGARSHHPEDYAEYVKGGDIIAFDIYPVTHPSPEVAGKLEFVARGVARLRQWAKDGQAVWSDIGATRISNPDVKPTPEQVRAEVWMSLIQGARGIIYFVHQFKPRFIEAALFEDPDVLAEVTRINAQIRDLAPVLNSRTIDGEVKVNSADPAVPVAAMVKRYGGHTYVFAVGMAAGRTRASFRDRSGAIAGKVTVIGEDRAIEPEAGGFADDFGPYALHLYRYSGTPLAR